MGEGLGVDATWELPEACIRSPELREARGYFMIHEIVSFITYIFRCHSQTDFPY